MSWLTSDVDSERFEQLQNQCRQKDILYSTLCHEHDKIKRELQEALLAIKEANYKLSLEANRAILNEKALEQRQEECKTFAAQRCNLESTIDSLHEKIKVQTNETKQLQKELDGQADNFAYAEKQMSEEKDKLLKRNTMIEAELHETQSELSRLKNAAPVSRRQRGSSTEFAPESGRVQSRIAELEAENATLKARQTPVSDSASTQKRTRRRSSSFGGIMSSDIPQSEINGIKTRLEKAENDLINASNRNMALQKESEREQQRLKEKIQDLEDALEERSGTVNSEGEDLRSQLAQLLAEKGQIEDNLETSKQHCLDAQAQTSTLQDLVRVKSEELCSARQETSRLSDQVEALTAELEHLRRSSDAAEEQMSAAEDLITQAQEQIEQHTVALSQRDAELKELRLQLEVAHKAAEELAKEREHLLTDAVKSEANDTLIKDLRDTLVASQQATAYAEQRCVVVEAEIENHLKKVNQLEKDLEDAREETTGNTQQMLDLQAQVSTALSELKDAELAKEQAEGHLEESRGLLETANDERERLQSELDDALSACAELQERIEATNGELAEMTRLAKRDFADIPGVQKIQFDLSNAREEIETLQRTLKEAETLEDGLLSERVQASETTVKLQSDLTDMKDALEEAREAERSALFAAEVAKGEHQAAMDEAKAYQDELEEELEALEDAYSVLEDQLARKDQEVDQLSADKDILRKSVSALDDQIQLAASSTSAKVAEYKDVIDKLEEQVATLKSAVAESESRLETFEVAMAVVESKTAPLVDNNVSSKDDCQPPETSAQLQQASHLVTRLRAERDELLEKVAFLTAEVEVAALANNQAQIPKSTDGTPVQLVNLTDADNFPTASWDNDKLLKLQKKLSESQARVLRRTETIAVLQSRVSQLSAQLAIAQDSAVDLEKQLELHPMMSLADTTQLQSKLAQTREKLQEEQNKVADLEDERASKLIETESARETLDALQAELAHLKSDSREKLSETQSRLDDAKADLVGTQSQLTQTISQRDSALAAVKDLEVRLSEKEREAAEATFILQTMSDERLQMQQTMADMQAEESSLGKESMAETVDRLQAEIGDMKASLARLGEERETAHLANLQVQADLERVTDERDAAQIFVEELETKLKELAGQLEAARMTLQHDKQTAEDRAQAQEETARAKEHQIETFKKDVTRLQKEIHTLRGLIAQKDETASQMEATLNMTRSEAETLVADFNLCSAELERRHAEEEAREEEFAQQEAALAALETDRAALRANVEGLESRVTHLESELERSQRQASADGETNAKIADLEEQLRMRTEEIDETEDRYLESLKEIKKLNTKIERWQIRCETLQRTIKSLEEIRKQSAGLRTSNLPDEAEQPASQISPQAVAVPDANIRQVETISKKRMMPAEFDSTAGEARAIAIIKPTTPRAIVKKPIRTPPSTSSRQRALSKAAPVLKPVSANTAGGRRLSVLPDPSSSKQRPTSDPNKLLADLAALRKVA